MIGATSSENAAKTQANAANVAAQIQKKEFDQTQQNLSPFINAGPGSVNSLQALLSGGPGTMAALQQTPGYQFTLDQGLQSIIDQRTATGGVGGGNTLKALMSYGSGLASGTYEQAVNNAYNLASLSENAAAGLGSIGQQSASAMGQDLIGGANATAAGQVGAANAINGGINNVSSNFLLASLLQNGGGFSALGA